MTKKLQLGVLISGNGTNLQSIIDNCAKPDFPAEVKIVISNNVEAYGLVRAKSANIPSTVIDHKNFADRQSFEDELIKILNRYEVELVCLAGFMRILTPHFLRAFPNRIINIHPALLPSFPGIDAQRQALDHGVKVSGCTVHFVNEGADSGPIIMQRAVAVLENDTEESLKQRILEQEHIIYPLAIKWYADNQLKIIGKKVLICHV